MGKKKSLKDYHELAEIKGVKFVLKTIPKSANDPCLNGWKCNNHFRSLSYSDLKRSRLCSECKNKHKKTIEDYHKLAKENNGKFLSKQIPENVTTHSLWKCSNASHSPWMTSYHNIKNQETWCPFCAKIRVDLNSYQNIAKIQGGIYFLENIPEKVTIPIKGWKCNNNHIFQTSYSAIQRHGTWCGYCNERKRSIEDYKNLAVEWNVEYVLYDIPKSTHDKAIKAWKCNKNHLSTKSYYQIISNGYHCSLCGQSSLERKVCKILTEMKIEFECEYKIETHKSFPYKYDIFIEPNILIELDGKQHFEELEHFTRKKSFDSHRLNDVNKNILAYDRGFRLIRMDYKFLGEKSKNEIKQFLLNYIYNYTFIYSVFSNKEMYDWIIIELKNQNKFYTSIIFIEEI